MKARIVVLVAALALFSGCSAPGVSAEYSGGDGDYISGDGTTQFWAEANRGDPIEFSGTTESGETLSSDDFAGQVVLVNFWYAACGPCRKEAPDLVSLYDDYATQGVGFLGVNIRDDGAQALSFATKFDVSYPSIIDVSDGEVTIAFARPAPPTVTPTTFLLDREGRVAARITSAIQSTSVVASMIDDLLAES